jgi:hypothetical protein
MKSDEWEESGLPGLEPCRFSPPKEWLSCKPMLRFPTWCLLGVGAFAGCRLGYDEISVGALNAAGQGGASVSGGSGGTPSRAGEAGADDAGGAFVTGGSGGSTANGGGSAMAGEGGALAFGGVGGAAEAEGGTGGPNGGSTDGASGGAAGTSEGATAGASGESAEGGASDGGVAGVSGGGGGSGGGLGAGGFAGAASLGDCQTGTFGGHDYVFCNVNLSWTVARDNCGSIGMFLVRVDDDAESQWVYDNVYDAPPRQGVWIGASDIAVEGEWRWPDGELFWLGDSSGSAQDGRFAAWYSTQPSGQEPRDCAAVDGNTLGWYDLDCMTPQPYVCESP